MTTTTTTTYGTDGKPTETSKTTVEDTTKPGDAWVLKNGKWVKPAAPKGVSKNDLAWSDNKGWVTKSQQAEEWAYPMAVINSDKSGSLQSVFDAAWKDEKQGAAWDQAKFTNAVKATAWYKNRNNAQRQYDALAADPTQHVELYKRINTQLGLVRTLAEQQGIQFSDNQLKQIARQTLRNGNDQTELNGIFANYMTTSKGGLKGFFDKISGTTGVGADKNDILDWAKNNGVTVSDSWVTGQVQQILAGKHDVQKSKDYITSLAKLAFPVHADKIDHKSSVMDLAQTYIQKISTMLETPYEQLNLSNQHLQKALQPDENNKPKNLTQVEQELRGTSDWAKTNNAKETTNNVINNILNKFGLM